MKMIPITMIMKENMKMTKYIKNKKLLSVLIAFTIGVIIAFGYYRFNLNVNSQPATVVENTQVFTLEQLKQYDGTDPSKPIYLAYDNNVYDVTAGKEFYTVGGSYHYLAGKDSTSELNMFGGEIIKKKYPVIGIIK